MGKLAPAVLCSLALGAGPVLAATLSENGQESVAQPITRAGPSFPCPTPRDPLGQLICGSPVLSRVDLNFVQTYQALRQQLSPEEQKALRLESIDFGLSVRAACGIGPAVGPNAPPPPPAPPASLSCVELAYNHQRALWAARLSGPAAQEASRPLDQQIALQRDLQQIGLLPAGDSIDGVYGTDTRNAIVAFQQTMGLPVTGLLGDNDAGVLEQQATLHQPRPQTALAPAPSPAVPVRTAWEEFQGVAMAMRVQASVPAGGVCAVSLEIRNPEALANATRDYDRESNNGVQDGDAAHLFKAELMFLRTQIATRGVHAFYASQPNGTDRCQFKAVAYGTDVYGRDVPEPLFSFFFDRDTYSKVVWDRFDPANMPKIVSSFEYGAYSQERLREINGPPSPQDSGITPLPSTPQVRAPMPLPPPPAAPQIERASNSQSSVPAVDPGFHSLVEAEGDQSDLPPCDTESAGQELARAIEQSPLGGTLHLHVLHVRHEVAHPITGGMTVCTASVMTNGAEEIDFLYQFYRMDGEIFVKAQRAE